MIHAKMPRTRIPVSTISSTSGTVPLNQWTHVAATMDGTPRTVKLYINGVLAGTHTMDDYFGYGSGWPATAYPNNNPLIIGGNDNYFEGNIDEVRVWNVVRSQTQIQNNMNQELSSPGSQTGLVGYWSFNETSGPYAMDSSTNSNTGLLNAAFWSGGFSALDNHKMLREQNWF